MLSLIHSDSPQGRHRRQNSTPTTAANSPKVETLDNRDDVKGFHRRGLSLDQTITPKNARLLCKQETARTSVESLFPRQHHQQGENFMQEAQRQPIQARPGLKKSLTNLQQQQQQQQRPTTPLSPRLAHGITSEQMSALITYWESNNGKFLSDEKNAQQILDPDGSAGYLDGFGAELREHAMRLDTRESSASNIAAHMAFAQQTGAYNAVLSTEASRPHTPPSQIRQDHFPLTPATTPFSRGGYPHGPYCRTADSSPTRRDPGLSVDTSHFMQRASSHQDIFEHPDRYVMSPVPSPPHTAPMKHHGSIDKADFPALDIFNMSKLQTNVPPGQGGYDDLNFSPLSRAESSAMSSFQSSPEMPNLPLFGEVEANMDAAAMASRLSSATETQSNIDMAYYPSPGKESAHRRNESSSDLGELEEIVDDTGVTSDEIASFISGPNANNKWTCLYTDCGKEFGRKENIKSHVQTHLNDRQFKCRRCNKRFVRQHDLKRHANIHSNDREYICKCNKTFARQDALTRHKQRGMCIGAFEGCIKKVGKRGRPKKAKVVTHCNDEKAAKTRMEVLERMGIDSSSCSSSVVSHPSPRELAGPTSPQFDGGHVMSPQQSQQSHVSYFTNPSQATSPVLFPQLPMSRQDSSHSAHSQYSTLPELEICSSSPAASKNNHEFSGSDIFTGSSISATSLNVVSSDIDQFLTSEYFDKDFTLDTDLGKSTATPSAPSFLDLMDFGRTEESKTDLHDDLARGSAQKSDGQLSQDPSISFANGVFNHASTDISEFDFNFLTT